MLLTLSRDQSSDNCTLGALDVDGTFFCFTLEDVCRPAGVKIPGQTAIPPGRYEIIINWSNRFKQFLPLLLNVPYFIGIRIHSGNTAAHTEGCLLVGRTKTVNSIGQSRAAFNALFKKLSVASKREKIHIHILGATPDAKNQPGDQTRPRDGVDERAPVHGGM